MENRLRAKIVVFFLMYVFIFFSFLKIVDNSFLNSLGDILLIISVFISIFYVKNKPSKKIIITFLPLLLLSILYFLSSFLSVNFGLSIQRGFIIFFTVILMLVFYDLGRQDEDNLLLTLIKLFLILNVGAIFLSFFYNPQFVEFRGFFLNSNSFGLFSALLFLSLFALVGGKSKFLIFILGLFFLGISTSRTALISFLIAVFLILGSNIILKNKFIYLFIFIFIALMSFVNIYIMIFSDLSYYNEVVLQYTGKNLLSGRNEIWQFLIPYIQQKPLLGWGGGVNIDDISYFSYSAHNAYIQYIIQVGLLGLSFIFLFFGLIWMYIIDNKNIYSRYCLGFVFWIFFVQNFEITFLQNNIALSLPILILLSYFLGKDTKIRL